MTLICSHYNAFISTIAKHVHTYNLNLQSYEVVFRFFRNKFPLRVNLIEGD